MCKLDKMKFGAVVMLDALGARSLTINDSIKFLKLRARFLRNVNTKLSALHSLRLHDERIGKPKIVTFGDTIVLAWPLPEQSPERALPMLGEWLRPSVMAGLLNSFVFRGAFSVGHYVIDGSTIIGPAIADAANWYESAQWLGIIATPSCGHRLSYLAETLRLKGYDIRRWYVQYDVPMKLQRSPMWAVSWPAQFPSNEKQNGKDSDSIVTGPQLLFGLLATFPIPKGTEHKYVNTIEFFDWYRANVGLMVGEKDEEAEVLKSQKAAMKPAARREQQRDV